MQFVRNRRIPGRERPLRPFEGLYGFAILFNWFLVSSVALFAVYAIVLLVVNFISPSLLKSMDETITKQLVIKLASRQDYESAISLMDITLDQSQKERPDNLYRLGLSYSNTGEYSNALSCLHKLQTARFEPNNDTDTKAHQFVLSRILCHVYINLGDYIRANECRSYMEEIYPILTPAQINAFSKWLSHNLGDGFLDDNSWLHLSPEYERALIQYSKDPDGSIQLLSRFISQEILASNLTTNAKLSFINTIIGWKFENGHETDALNEIAQAVALADNTFYMEQFEQFGQLAFYCKTVGNTRLYERLMRAYKRYLYNTHKKNSPEALVIVKYLVDKGRFYQAEHLLNKICRNLREKIQLNIPIMSDDQREHYIKSLEEPFAYTEELLTSHPSPLLANVAAENALFKKGLLLRSNRRQRIAIQSQKDSILVEKYDELVSLRKEYNVIKSISLPDQIVRKTLLEKQIFKLDIELANSCSDYIRGGTNSEMSIDRMKESLGRRNVFVYLASNRKDHLFALEITKRKGVWYHDLGYFDGINLKDGYNPDWLYNDTDVTKQILGKLSFSNKGKRIYYCSTSGIYNRIAIPALKVSQDEHLMDVADIRFISDPSSISHIKAEDKIVSGTISLWGGVHYSNIADTLTSTSHRSIIRGEHLAYLPNSLTEVKEISSILSTILSGCNIYTGGSATEASFKERDGKGDAILHISTHGFFNDKDQEESSEFAMDNSGLLFAGAERCWTQSSSPDTDDDGILKASEIELMNLNGCELVVLSACETGLGFDNNSEGVYGLQRAFKLAGVNNILMSLWEIPDKTTSELMKYFYQSLIIGDDLNTALVKAQKKIRENSDIDSPESWGGFVLLN